MFNAHLIYTKYWLLVFFIFSASADAKLIVIYDSGKTYPISKYVNTKRVNASLNRDTIPKKPKFRLYPVASKSLSPGKLISRSNIKLPSFIKPVFIIGNDSLSLQWLESNVKKLIKLNAVGILTQVSSKHEYNSIRLAYPNLRIIPTVADGIAKKLEIKHYPVLITNNKIIQ